MPTAAEYEYLIRFSEPGSPSTWNYPGSTIGRTTSGSDTPSHLVVPPSLTAPPTFQISIFDGIERLAKKYATKFPDFVATILAMNAPATPATSIPAAITNASEEVKTIKRKRKSRAKAIGKLKKDGTPDRRYLNQPATA
jgi:hypothetical protein